MTTEQIKVETVVPTDPAQAWDLFTSPDSITKWNFAMDDWHCPTADVDLRVGGLHKTRMEAKDGSFGFDFEGVYSEVQAPHALTLVLTDGRKTRTTFTASADNETLVETVFDTDGENPVELQRAGWQSILDNYRRHVERTSAA